jgi:chondroitin-sulfate-ABC endolyase/exolyase
MRFYSNLLTWPLSLSGRHPDGLGHIEPLHFAKLAITGNPNETENIDTDLASAYLRLVQNQPTALALIFQKAGITAEKSPIGNRSFPYSCLNIHRRDNWMISTMGHSRYFWATESYVGANHYGRYLNHGHLQIMASGQPISNFSSGYNQKGWDWNHFPGTTATTLAIKELRADIKNIDVNSGYEEMLFSDEAFAGGISIKNENGFFAMKLHEHDKYNGSLRALKSYFFFDNRIVALGSNIQSKLADKEVHTTLFQVYQSKSVNHPTVNEKIIDEFPFLKTYKAKKNEFSDGLNNYFFVKNGDVVLQKKTQYSLHEETDASTKNPFATAYINHGKQPKNDSYQYFVLIQPDKETLKTNRKNQKSIKKSPYLVLQQDTMAHVVYDRATQTTAFVFYEAGKYENKKSYVAVNIPSLVMIERVSPEKMNLSVADPDLHFYEGPADEIYDTDGKRIERSVYSRKWINNPSGKSEIELVIAGDWKIEGKSEYIHVKNHTNGKTTFIINCQHGLSREAVLTRYKLNTQIN